MMIIPKSRTSSHFANSSNETIHLLGKGQIFAKLLERSCSKMDPGRGSAFDVNHSNRETCHHCADSQFISRSNVATASAEQKMLNASHDGFPLLDRIRSGGS